MIKIQTARRKLTIEPGKPSVEQPAQGLFHPPMALSAPPRATRRSVFSLVPLVSQFIFSWQKVHSLLAPFAS